MPTAALRTHVNAILKREWGNEDLLITILDRIQALEEHAKAQDPGFTPAAEREP